MSADTKGTFADVPTGPITVEMLEAACREIYRLIRMPPMKLTLKDAFRFQNPYVYAFPVPSPSRAWILPPLDDSPAPQPRAPVIDQLQAAEVERIKARWEEEGAVRFDERDGEKKKKKKKDGGSR